MKLVKFTTTEDVVAYAVKGAFRKIGIDGVDGAGKSTLAEKIGAAMHIKRIGLDEYLDQKRGGFLKHLNYPDIAAAVQCNAFVIEGVCLLEVLERLHCTVDLLIYVQRTHYGVWIHRDTCDIEGDVEKVIERKREILRTFVIQDAMKQNKPELDESVDLSELNEELIRYHARHKPHLKAQVLYRHDVHSASNGNFME